MSKVQEGSYASRATGEMGAPVPHAFTVTRAFKAARHHVHRWTLAPALEVKPSPFDPDGIDGELYVKAWRNPWRSWATWPTLRLERGNVPGTCGCGAHRLFHPFTARPDPLAVLAA